MVTCTLRLIDNRNANALFADEDTHVRMFWGRDILASSLFFIVISFRALEVMCPTWLGLWF